MDIKGAFEYVVTLSIAGFAIGGVVYCGKRIATIPVVRKYFTSGWEDIVSPPNKPTEEAAK